jgi:hypothetical protein
MACFDSSPAFRQCIGASAWVLPALWVVFQGSAGVTGPATNMPALGAVARFANPDDEAPASAAPFTRDELERQTRIARCLKIYYQKPVDADLLRPWSIMHGLIAFGRDSQVFTGGQRVNAAEYLCSNGPGNGLRLMHLHEGQLRTGEGKGLQGHSCQLLAILAQANVPTSQPITVEGKSFTIQDLIEHEQRGCRSGTELTFKLIALAHYLEPEATWTNDLGERWDMQRLIREELAQPVQEGACGGTHRLMAFSFALLQLERRDIPLAGEWLKAARLLAGFEQRAFKLQNRNGGFSTEFFDGPGDAADPMMQLYSTGHILEWLAFSLTSDQLREPRVAAAADRVLDLLLEAPDFEVDVGPRGHALHALAMYEYAVFGQSSNYLDYDLAQDDPARAAIARLPRQTKAIIHPASATLGEGENRNPDSFNPRPMLRRRR